MVIDVVLDLQFGDGGKGRIVDYKSKEDYDIIARFNGGPNSGHVIKYKNKEYALHLIPSGIFWGKKCFIGNGVVIDPISLRKEIEMVEIDGIDVRNNLYISKYCHLITPKHIEMEVDNSNSNKIGTTKRGVGPCNQDKVNRTGIRVCDITEKYLYNLKNNYWNVDDGKVKSTEYIESLKFLMTLNQVDNSFLEEDSIILSEGAQGTLLDIDFGTYPYVTSTCTTIGSVMMGLGVSHKNIRNVYGIFKAYMTRVGNGPFVSELFDETSDKIRKIGNEYGSTTGRPRRCGWLDLPTLKYACQINGVTELIMTKADILDDFDEVKLCVGYTNNEDEYYDFNQGVYNEDSKPIYQSFKGWNTVTNKEPLERYIEYIEMEVGVPVTLVSYGKDRNSIYERNYNFSV